MLKPALLFKEELNEIIISTWDNPKYKYYHIGFFDTPNVETSEWNNIRRVSLFNEKLIGYLSAYVDRTNNIISNLCLLSVASSFKEYKEFERDLLLFMENLLQNYTVIQWNVVYDNPVRKKYEKFCKVVGGNIVGIHHKSAKIGLQMLDEELFELLSSEQTLSKIRLLRERIKQ